MTSTAGALLRASFRVDRSKIQLPEALRAGCGVALALAVGLTIGRPLDGAIAAGGALSAGFAALTTGYRARARTAVVATAGLTLSTFVGAAVAGNVLLLAAVLALWALVAGMLVSLGHAASIVGLQAVVGLLLISPYPMSVVDASGRAGLVAAGGLAQVLLVVTLWPLRRAPAERRALAAAYASLAHYADALPDAPVAPPDSSPLETARIALADPQPFATADTRLAFQLLFEQAESLRTTLAALAQLRPRLAGVADRVDAVAAGDELVRTAAQVLTSVAGAVVLPRTAARRAAIQAAGSAASPRRWGRLLAAVDTLASEVSAAGPARKHAGASLVGELHRLGDDLVGQLDVVVQGVRGVLDATAGEGPATGSRRPRRGSMSLTVLRANLTLRSPVLRHALRLSAVVFIGSLLSRLLAPEHRYWLPLTALVVLRPDFTSTVTRGLGRIAGTLVGATITTALVAATSPPPAVLAVLVVLAAVTGYTVVFANYAAYGVAITAFVVLLLAFLRLPGAGAVTERVEATLLGGLLALAAYLLWPTWERVRLAEGLARLLEAQRDWAVTLLQSYATRGSAGADVRARARVARTNAEASLARAQLEPARRGLDLATATALVDAGRRYALALLALQAHLPETTIERPLPELDRLADELRGVLTELAAALRAGRRPVALPSLHVTRRALGPALAALPPGTALDVAVLDVELDRLVSVTAQVAALVDQAPERTASAVVRRRTTVASRVR